ncbi:zinc finger, CCHC-type containing protein [Tanacetum coccineum]
MHSMEKTVNELHAMLKLHEQTLSLPKTNGTFTPMHFHAGRKGKNKATYAPKPKIPPSPKKEDPAKDSICHECGETGHWKRNYPQYLAELLKKKKNTASGGSGSSIFGLRASRKLKPGALSLYVGNGQREAVEAIGVFIYHSLADYVIPRDGIFEIDLFNSCINESSMYAVSNKRAKLNLYSALLWHCRLGHISKKRIKKLQHDELPNLTDLRAFKEYIPCEYMSQEFLDHLKDHGIIAHRTPPYTPQHNGVLERRNRTLLDMVQSMMSQTTLPKSFWDYALETAARILNMVPT